MATHLDTVEDMYSETIGIVTSSADEWMSFMKCASMNYKYDFSDQLLIYAQKPTAVACADFNTWNNTLKRYINKGAKGIALLDYSFGRQILRYVFDISDTHSSYFKKEKQIKLWKVGKSYEKAVIESLEDKYVVLENSETLPDALKSLSKILMEDNYTDYFNEFVSINDSNSLESSYKELLENSVAYMIINRCGIDPSNYFDKEVFSNINLFGDIASISNLGTAISEISQMGIYEIYKTLKNIRIYELEKIHTFDKEKNIVYDDNERRRNDVYDTNLYNGRRLPNTKLESKRNEKEQSREVFNDEVAILERTQETSLSKNVDERNSNYSLGGGRNGITREIKNDNQSNENETKYNRGIESTRPNEVDRSYEQHQESSRRNDNERTNLYLTDNSTTPYVVVDEKVNKIIRNTPFLKKTHDEIKLFFIEEKDTSKREDFIKELFNDDYAQVIVNNSAFGYKSFDNGVLFWEGDYNTRDKESFIKWNDLVNHFDSMIYLKQFDELENGLDIDIDDNFVNKYLKESNVSTRYLIYNQFQKNLTKEDNIAYLKDFFGLGGVSSCVRGSGIGASYDSSGITFNRGYFESDAIKKTFSWRDIANRIKNLISAGMYITNDEIVKEKQKTQVELEEIENEVPVMLTEKNEIITEKVKIKPSQLSLFATYEQELADRLLEIFNSFDTKYKDNLYVKEIELKEWEHISSDKKNLSIRIASNKYDAFDENSFTQFNTDKTDENIIRKGIEDNSFIKYLNKDEDFSIILTPTDITIYYHNFEDKDIDFSIGRNEVLSISKTEEIIDNPIPDINLKKIVRKHKPKVIDYVLHPEIPYEERINYKIITDELGVGTPKERYRNNIYAIKVLKKCEEENRYATPEEQQILSKYVGWGGLANAFDSNNSDWKNEYNELKELLTEEEYKKAKETTLTAFYTPPVVIRSMYKALENMGLQKGNVLEPSCGIGNFIGMLPNNDDLKIYGVELDSISGRIARQLYQKSSIAINGFEDVNYSDSFFDVAIGNVPFGDFKVLDKKYDKNNFLIHDYFFAKTIDKVRPGGVIAFISSRGTMDKQNSDVRKYIASRANLLGAIRLPNDTFKSSAGTTVTTDIIFLQKRDSITDIMPSWVEVGRDENNIPINNYYIEHPENILGKYELISSQFGMTPACLPYDDKSLEEQLNNVIPNIHAEIKEYVLEDSEDEVDNSIEADLNVKNFSYTVIDNKVYYRENSRMYPQNLALTTENRVKGLIEIRDCTRELLDMQLDDYTDEEIEKQQVKLNDLYDKFTKKYGLINSRVNASAFNGDNSYYLLCSLEILDENGNLKRKADMFTKRTIMAHRKVQSIDSANDALIVSIGEKAKVDLDFMSEISNKDKETLIKDLEGIIFKIPNEDIYVTDDEYLSGNIREKLKEAETANEEEAIYDINIKALKDSIPKDLNASEISVRLGTTWIPPKDYEDFMHQLFNAGYYVRSTVRIKYSELRNEWYIENKGNDKYNSLVNSTYGTKRVNGYKILEDTLNLRDVKVYDYYEDENGKKKQELNAKETAIAQSKQEQIKQAFQDWIWSDPDRRIRLEKKYNELFNSIKPRDYDGSNIIFSGMNPEIKLREHQINAIARILYGGNTLLAHEVGAGKTFEMVAAAMESKRLGLCNKSLFVVPNHIIEQFASEFLQLYPSANILVATKKDFETANRKKFCSRIATGEYDAVIIGHSQFEKIPMSTERQITLLENEIKEITEGIEDSKRNGASFTVKQLEKSKKMVESKLKKLNDVDKKDDNVVTFEQLGVDRLFVDEAHYYKNLYLYTKMHNVSGIAQTEAQKSSDLYMKCKYLDEITNNKGIIFATGTPVSNSMVELYTMQRYLQFNTLNKLNLQNFDAWASTFGETTTAIELAPEGTGYRAKTRFAKFFNLPELINLFKEVADIKTSDMLDLPVPNAHHENVVVNPSEVQLKMVEELSKRAEEIRGGNVDPHDDNMLKITNDGKKIALDPRMINEMLPDFEDSKVNTCVNRVYDIYKEYDDIKASQLIFCDSSTPKSDGTFSVYNDIKTKLINKGIPDDEIAFIHDADTEEKKQALFSKVRKGQVRVLIGSTQKMGAGTNCQERLIANHNLDCPWRPADLTQRGGRIIRQGNINKDVYVYTYVTQKTFDAYLYQLVENKQKFISQIMTSRTPLRSATDVDETVLSYAEIKALAAGNPLILEKTELDAKVSKLKLLKQSHLSQIYELQNKVLHEYPKEIKVIENNIADIEKDIQVLNENRNGLVEGFSKIEIGGNTYTERKDGGEALLEVVRNKMFSNDEESVGHYLGFEIFIGYNFLTNNYYAKLKCNHSYMVDLGNDPSGNITRIDNELNRMDIYLTGHKNNLERTIKDLEVAKVEMNKPFNQEEELNEAMKRLREVDKELKIDDKDNQIIDDGTNIPNENKKEKSSLER